MERWATVKRLHQVALETEESRRAEFLAEACAGDEALRREVESLLAYETAAQPFMEAPAIEVTARSAAGDQYRQLVGRTLSHYRIESLLGVGGMGEVYLARDPRLERRVALKILPPDLAFDSDRLERFTREAKAASALNHPNVATIHDIGEADHVRFIVMEYVEGETIAARIIERPLTAQEVVDVAVQVADALDSAHGKGITHRDIKPGNLMLTPRGQVKVLDFGIAKTTRTEALTASGHVTTEGQTGVGLLIGSVPYMSPEQVRGRAVDHRSDLFSLGVTLYELTTGRHPFTGAAATETMDRILHAHPEPITGLNSSIPPELERIAFKCLEKDLERRYQSARELLADLRHLQQTHADCTRYIVDERRRHNLPVQLTSFVGREREIEEVRRLLAGSRLLTLTGAGGCGKTRLALQVASQLQDQFGDGVWVVDLAPLSEPALIAQAVAATLGVREGPNRSLREALAEYCRPRHLLLVLDNCEHLIAACAQLVDLLLRAALKLHVLATSREGLGIGGETVWRVPSMSAPPFSEPITCDALQQYEAARLFTDRAATVAPAFTASAENAATVATICRRLDGIPLAIELAAARLTVLSVDQINERLKDRFRLLTGGSRTAVARQRTLEATIDWSYDLLSEAERTLLCRLSVFPGGWTLEAAEDVCAANGIERENMLDLLSWLVDKSLVNVEEAIGGRRYHCLETIRQYGRERLVRSGDTKRVRDRHRDFFFELVQRAEPELIRAEQVMWLNRLQVEHGNLRSALEWCLEDPAEGNRALEMAAALMWFWTKRGYFEEGRQWLERALAVSGPAPSAVRAKALIALAHMMFFSGDFPNTQVALDESLSLGRQTNDHAAIAWSLAMQSVMAIAKGELAQAAEYATEGRAAAITSGVMWLQCPCLESLAYYYALDQGNYAEAIRLTEEALAVFRGTGDTWGLAIHLNDLALLRVLDGQYAHADATCVEGIRLVQELADRFLMAYFLATLAASQAAQGRGVHAVRMWGGLEGLLESVGSTVQHYYMPLIYDPYVHPLKDVLGEAVFEAALSEGRAMSFAHAVGYALAPEAWPPAQ